MEPQLISSSRTGDCYYQYRHPSGLAIYLYPKERGSTTQAILGARYGSMDNCFQRSDEAAAQQVPEGIAHYLEHKLFESEDGDAFARFAAVGANANAYTGYDSTCYVFSCTDRLYESLEILLDFVQSPYFTPETVAKERGIIAQEIKMYDDLPSWRVFSNYLRAMYHQHPVREDAAGTVESIEKITPELLYRCYRTFYNLNNMVLVLAGNFDRDRVLAVCERMLKPCPSVQVRRVFPDEPETILRPLVEEKLSVSMPVFQFGYKDKGGALRSEQELAAVNVLLEVMASDASPLFRRLLDAGLVNDSSFSYQYFEGMGFATAMFGGESRDPAAAVEMIREEAARLLRQGISQEEFQRAKRSLYGDCIASLNSPASIANWLADSAFRGQNLFTYIDALADLRLEQAAEQCAIFREDRSVLSLITPC